MTQTAYYNVYRDGYMTPERIWDPYHEGNLLSPMDGTFLFLDNYASYTCQKYYITHTITNPSQTLALTVWWIVTDRDDRIDDGLGTQPIKDYYDGGNVKTMLIPPQGQRKIKCTVYPSKWAKRDSMNPRDRKIQLPTKIKAADYNNWTAQPTAETYFQLFFCYVDFPTNAQGTPVGTISVISESKIWAKVRLEDRREMYIIDRSNELLSENDDGNAAGMNLDNSHIEDVDIPLVFANEGP